MREALMLPMDEVPTPQLLDFLNQTVACCRSNAAYVHVPTFARDRLRDAGDNVDFFMRRREYWRAFKEARLAIRINSAVARYIQTSAEALDSLRKSVGET